MNFGFMVQHSNESQRNASKHFSFLFWKYDARVWEPGRGQKRFRLILLFVYSCQYNGWLVLLVSVMRFCVHNTTSASWRFQWWFEWVSNVCLFKLCLVITKRANQTVSSALSKRPSQPRDGAERPPPDLSLVVQPIQFVSGHYSNCVKEANKHTIIVRAC